MKGLNGWLNQLEGKSAAALAQLLRELECLALSEHSSGAQVGDVIRRDAQLTSNVIRVANSPMFNASEIPVTTVSRAVLNIGFEQVSSICISLKMMSDVLTEKPSDMLLARLANSLHGAAQARALVAHKSDTAQEEVYVAAMLSNLIELLILGSNEPDAKAFAEDINSAMTLAQKNTKAEKHLGVSLSRLSKTMMKRWRIEGLVNDVLDESGKHSELCDAVRLGNEIARCAQYGWHSDELFEALEDLSEQGGKSVKRIIKDLKAVAEEAEKNLTQLGSVSLHGKIVSGRPTGALMTGNDDDDTAELNDAQSEHIAAATGGGAELAEPHQVEAEATEHENSVPAHKENGGEPEAESTERRANPSAQLKTLQSLAMQLAGDFNINQVFKTVLQGLDEGVGLERCALALFEKSDRHLHAKYVVGEGTGAWKSDFVWHYQNSESEFLYQLFKHDTSFWLGDSRLKAAMPRVNPNFTNYVEVADFLVAPLLAQGRKIGVLYADMGVSQQVLTTEHFDGFNLFHQQLKLALNVLAAKSA